MGPPGEICCSFSFVAIHLATGRVLGENLDTIVSYDDRLLEAATDAGLATTSPQD